MKICTHTQKKNCSVYLSEIYFSCFLYQSYIENIFPWNICTEVWKILLDQLQKVKLLEFFCMELIISKSEITFQIIPDTSQRNMK